METGGVKLTVDDKELDRRRYDESARHELDELDRSDPVLSTGLDDTPRQYLPPYLHYYEQLRRVITPDSVVLELGAGSGRHTGVLTQRSRRVVASDISPLSLELCRRRTRGQAVAVCADIQALPFLADSFDVVTCAGSLSYGDPAVVDAEIRRVLRPGGAVVAVDSLNHNPVYRLNRWIQYRRGERTRSTMTRMPTMERMLQLARGFEQVTIDRYGSYLYLHPILVRALGPERAAEACEALDRRAGGGRNAFKIVMVAEGYRG